MIASITDLLHRLFGIGASPDEFTAFQVVLRGVVVYVSGVAMVRFAHRRFLGRHTPFDLILSILMGALLARAINGDAPLAGTLAAGFALVLLDRLFAAAAYYSEGFRTLVEGRPVLLWREGKPEEDQIRRAFFTEEDLQGAVRLAANAERLEEVREMRIEPGGEISAVV